MTVVLNGYPGVGKLTIGRILAERLSGRLVDIHTLYNLVFALTEPRTPAFRQTVRRVEAVADDLIGALPREVPVVFTTVLAGTSDWAAEEWDRFVLREEGRPPLVMVHLHCDLEENIRFIGSPERAANGELWGAEVARRNHQDQEPLIGADLPSTLRLDVTGMLPDEAAERIAEHCGRAERGVR